MEMVMEVVMEVVTEVVTEVAMVGLRVTSQPDYFSQSEEIEYSYFIRA
jgi:hypothetical protein